MLLYRSLTADRLWTILEASAPVTAIVPAAHRVKGDADGWLKECMLRGPGDFPLLEVNIGNNFDIAPFRIDTFGQEPANFDPVTDPWDAESSAEMRVRFIYRNLKQATDVYRDDLEMKVLAAFVAQGPTLGLPYVRNWRWRPVRTGKAVYVSTKGDEFPVTEATMPVLYLIDGQDLLPE